MNKVPLGRSIQPCLGNKLTLPFLNSNVLLAVILEIP